jgi:hypothetical protein
LKDDVIAIDIEEQPVDVVLKQIALVVHAEWREKDGIWLLSQNDEQKKLEYSWHQTRYHSILQAQLDALKQLRFEETYVDADADQYVKLKSATASPESRIQRRNRIQSLNPVYRFASRVFQRLTPEDFGRDCLRPILPILSSEKIPTRQKLKVDFSKEIKQFSNEQNTLLKFEPGSSDFGSSISRFDLVPIRFASTYPTIQLILFRKDGRQISNGFYIAPKPNFKPDFEFVSKRKLVNEVGLGYFTNGEGETEQAPLNLDPVESEKLVQHLRSTMSNAEVTDPLGFEIGRMWQEFAEKVKRPLLVNLSEDETNGVPKLENLPDRFGEVRVDQDGWILARPRDPLGNRTLRLERKFIPLIWRKFSESDRFDSIDDQLKMDFATCVGFYLSSGPPIIDELSNPYPQLLGGLFYGLESGQKQRLLNGELIRLKDLTSVEKDLKSVCLSEYDVTAVVPLKLGAKYSKELRFRVQFSDQTIETNLESAAYWLDSNGKLDVKNMDEIRKIKFSFSEVKRLHLAITSDVDVVSADYYDPVPITKKFLTFESMPKSLRLKLEAAYQPAK